MGERKGVYRVLVGNLRERNHLEDPGLDRTIILRWMFTTGDVLTWTGLIWLKIRRGGGHL